MPTQSNSQERSTVLRWKFDPLSFVREAILYPINKKRGLLGTSKEVRPTKQQEDALREVGRIVTAKYRLREGLDMTELDAQYAKYVGLSIQSGKGTGKDTFAAWIIIWFLVMWERSLVPCTGPSADQLNNVLWKEISIWVQDSMVEDSLTMQSGKVYMNMPNGKENWFATARTANTKADASTQAKTLDGLHAENMMVVVDEADGVPLPVFTSLESTLTKTLNFAILIFNPTRNTGFAIESQGNPYWIGKRWNAEESENVSKESIEYKKETYGIASNYYRVYVLGLPPVADDGALIPWDCVMDAIDREIEVLDEDPYRFGVDVGGGGDKSVICPVRGPGPKVYECEVFNSEDSTAVGTWIVNKMTEYDAAGAMVDCIGIGNGAYNEARKSRYRVYPVDVRRTARNKDRYFRLRDELWWKVREVFIAGTISIPRDQDLIDELCALSFEEVGTKIKVADKKTLKKKLAEGRSPDKADALMHSFYMNSENFYRPSDDEREENSAYKYQKVGSIRGYMVA